MSDERKVIPFPTPGDAERRAPGTVVDDHEGMEQLPIPGVADDGDKPPFRWQDPPYVEAWCRATDPKRDALIICEGENVRLYPSSRRADGSGYMVNARRRTCSNAICNKVLGDCVHLVEDDFRFGRYKGKPWVPPSRELRIGAKDGKGVTRHLRRPNPTIDGLKLETVKRRARQAMPTRIPEVSALLGRWARMELEQERFRFHGVAKPKAGRPPRDLVDIALAAVLRFCTQASYDDLAAAIPGWHAARVLNTEFSHMRVVEEMNREAPGATGLLIGSIIDMMTDRVHRAFRNVCSTFLVDGVTFSTAESDNPRTGRLSKSGGPVQLLVHSMYEFRFGLLTGYRVTWHQRGVGSGESPQFPHMLRMTKRVFDPELIIGDRSYSSQHNYWLCDQHGIEFACPIMPSRWKPETKDLMTPEDAERHLREKRQDAPGDRLRLMYPFQRRVEGWHSVVRSQTTPYLISEPDRSKKPRTKNELKKEDPESQYVGLPDDPGLRDAVIVANQQVGAAVENEFRCRRLVMALRAVVHAETYYADRFDPFAERAFVPRPEDALLTAYRVPDVA